MARQIAESRGPPAVSMGLLFRRYRSARQWTQRELADAANVSIGTLRDLEQGRTLYPRRGLVKSLVGALDIDMSQLAELFHPTSPGSRIPVAATPDEWRRGAAPLTGLRIFILGRVAAQRDGAEIDLGSIRQRCVLGLLALQHGAGIHQIALIDTIWSEQPPNSALAMVQGYIWQLRRVLGSESDHGGLGALIATTGARYRLETTYDQLDLADFQQLTDRAREAEAEDDPARACEFYEKALTLWRGEALADVDLLREHPAVVELTRARADTVVRYAECANRIGMPSLALPHLRNLCTRDRFNEHAHAQLMTALAADGQQAAALHVYRDLWGRLRNELGISPGALAVASHASVIRQHAGPPVLLIRPTGYIPYSPPVAAAAHQGRPEPDYGVRRGNTVSPAHRTFGGDPPWDA